MLGAEEAGVGAIRCSAMPAYACGLRFTAGWGVGGVRGVGEVGWAVGVGGGGGGGGGGG